MDYYFGEKLRWAWGWDSPNEAGIFWAMVLPLCWAWREMAGVRKAHDNNGIEDRRVRRPRPTMIRGGLWVVEGVVWLALASTFSRGAFLAALVGLVLWHIQFVGQWKVAGVRLLLGLGMMGVMGMGGRWAPDYLQTDGSVWNRWALWRGGFELMAAAPWTGWGAGQSGLMFGRWVQPEGMEEQYRSMVNSYLTVGVEYGLPLLWLMLLVIIGVMVQGWRRVPMMSTVWGIWAVGLAGSNLWIVPGLWVLPIGALGYGWWRGRGMLRAGWSGSAAYALGIIAMAGAIGWWRQGEPKFNRAGEMVRIGEGVVRQCWVVDEAVVGAHYGRGLRERYRAEGAEGGWEVVTEPLTKRGTEEVRWLILGKWASERQADYGKNWWAIHPVLPPPLVWPQGVKPERVILPEWDLAGVNREWRKRAEGEGIVIETSGARGREFPWPPKTKTRIEPRRARGTQRSEK
jgi:hypothetical protein